MLVKMITKIPMVLTSALQVAVANFYKAMEPTIMGKMHQKLLTIPIIINTFAAVFTIKGSFLIY